LGEESSQAISEAAIGSTTSQAGLAAAGAVISAWMCLAPRVDVGYEFWNGQPEDPSLDWHCGEVGAHLRVECMDVKEPIEILSTEKGVGRS
jgi:hypothetical protein